MNNHLKLIKVPIEKDIPIPDRSEFKRSAPPKYYHDMGAMEIGDSMWWEGGTNPPTRQICAAKQKYGRLFVYRRYPTGFRVWRVV